jgi:predicted nucleic acid-binding protein
VINALIDTDVLIDSSFQRQPFAGDSTKLLELCELGKIQGYTTPLLISNLYYLIRKAHTHENTISIVKKISQILTIIPVSKNSVSQAIESTFKDFEDALQYFTCMEHGNIQFIITRNKKDYKSSALAVMTPTEFLAHLSQNPPNNTVTGT